MKIILNYRPNVNQVDDKGRSALHHQAMSQCHTGIILLVENGANVDIKDKKNKYAIDYLKDKNFAHYLNWQMKEPRNLQESKKTRYLLKRDIASDLMGD